MKKSSLPVLSLLSHHFTVTTRTLVPVGSRARERDRLYLEPLGLFYPTSFAAQAWVSWICVTRYHSAIVLPALLLRTQWRFYCLANSFGIVLLTAISH